MKYILYLDICRYMIICHAIFLRKHGVNFVVPLIIRLYAWWTLVSSLGIIIVRHQSKSYLLCMGQEERWRYYYSFLFKMQFILYVPCIIFIASILNELLVEKVKLTH